MDVYRNIIESDNLSVLNFIKRIGKLYRIFTTSFVMLRWICFNSLSFHYCFQEVIRPQISSSIEGTTTLPFFLTLKEVCRTSNKIRWKRKEEGRKNFWCKNFLTNEKLDYNLTANQNKALLQVQGNNRKKDLTKLSWQEVCILISDGN